ncbi:adenylate kinase [Streptomyces sp. J2-1]|uniref:adenylate kinase n=1 Tax=Streptomyces corallincola TaxID=2851888 RepID=UPI001C38F757|nr:adenylate kinase [Streptomyces corallincola]MBV2358090.1 adenylate kinase [Streptomyces corallincola]
MQRALIAGVTGAGKSTLARTLSTRLHLPYHEMDALYYDGPDWTRNKNFTAQVEAITTHPHWIIDSLGYPEVRDLLWTRADTVIWLDYPMRTVMPRILRRSLHRTLTREPLYGGNRETWHAWLTKDHPAWWSWTQHTTRHKEIKSRTENPRFAHLTVHHFTHPEHTATWLKQLPPHPTPE